MNNSAYDSIPQQIYKCVSNYEVYSSNHTILIVLNKMIYPMSKLINIKINVTKISIIYIILEYLDELDVKFVKNNGCSLSIQGISSRGQIMRYLKTNQNH